MKYIKNLSLESIEKYKLFFTKKWLCINKKYS